MHDGNRQRVGAVGVQDTADDEGRLVAEEQRRQHVDLEIRRNAQVAEILGDGAHHIADIAREIVERALKLEIVDDALEARRHALAAARIVGAEGRPRGRLLVLDVLGRDGRAHEDEVVVEVRAVQDARAYRVEERLGQFGLVVIGQQADVVQLDLLPDLVFDIFRVVFVFQDHAGFAYPLVVEVDAVALQLQQAMPVGRFELQLGLMAHLAEQPVVLVKPVQHGPGHVVGDLRGQQLGEVGHVADR